MKIGILKYPGGHGDNELKYILQKYFNEEVSDLWHHLEYLSDFDLIFVPGGFPCREKELGRKCFEDSPALNSLKGFAARGKYIIGVGSGFQMLCETGLLPGHLLVNSSQKYVCKYAYIKAEDKGTILTSGIDKDDVFSVPISTLYGRYEASEAALVEMRRDGQILFRFCDFTGRISEAVNYTGSMNNIAAISNVEKNVFGMITLPERAVIEITGLADGNKILGGLIDEIKKDLLQE